MKKALLIILCSFLLTQVLNAQKVHFTDTSNKWKEVVDHYNDGLGGLSYFTYKYVQDTTINGTAYRWFDYTGDFSSRSLVKEDTILKKVYIRNEASFTNSDTDVVLMDYNLIVGDTFNITFYQGAVHFQYIVTAVDSTVINGTWHKVWFFSHSITTPGGPLKPIIIEGIGCIQHPLYMIINFTCVECDLYYMYCFSNNGINPAVSPAVPYDLNFTVWPFDNTSSCDLYLHLKTEELLQNKKQVSISPNPATSVLNLDSREKIKRVVITSITGQSLYTSNYEDEAVQVDVSALAAGIYFVKINDTEVRKFVKQ